MTVRETLGDAMSGEFEVGAWRVHALEGWIRREDAHGRLSPKQMALLCYFAERPGQLLTKEVLIAGVWPDALVEDGAVARCLSELRRALGDDAQRPRYIETLPRRGYRFIAPVRQASGERATTRASRIRPQTVGTAASTTGRRHVLPQMTALAVATLSVLFGLRAHSARPSLAPLPSGTAPAVDDTPDATATSSARTRIAVLGFRNLSPSDELAWLATALPEMLAAELGASPALEVVARPTVVTTPQRTMSVATATEVQRRRLRATLGVDSLVSGSFLTVEASKALRIDLWLTRSPEGRVEVLSEEGRTDDVLELAAALGARLRDRLGVAEDDRWSSFGPAIDRRHASLLGHPAILLDGLDARHCVR